MPKGIYNHKPCSEETKRKMSISKMGDKNPAKRLDVRKKIRKIKLGKSNPKLSETRKRLFKEGILIHPLLNTHRSDKTKRKLQKNAKLNSNYGMKNKHHSEESKEKIRLNNSGKIRTKESREKISISSKKKWSNPKWKKKQIKLILNGLMKRPTSFEKFIIDLCLKFNLPFVYTGDGRVLINYKNPDFINEKDKVVIEVFFSRFKIFKYKTIEKYKEHCMKKYGSAGYKVVFLDENDLKKSEIEIVNKIKEFMK